MKYLIILGMAITMPVQAGNLLWVDSSMVTSYNHSRGKCDTFKLGVGEKEYSLEVCVGQTIINDYMNSMLTSPTTRECVRSEVCRRDICHREYGIREVNVKLLLQIGKQNKIESIKLKNELGECR